MITPSLVSTLISIGSSPEMLFGKKPVVLQSANLLLPICVHSKRYTIFCQAYFSISAEVLDGVRIERNERKEAKNLRVR
jgi:hypothetical protein